MGELSISDSPTIFLSLRKKLFSFKDYVYGYAYITLLIGLYLIWGQKATIKSNFIAGYGEKFDIF
jgi:hypothetical protein